MNLDLDFVRAQFSAFDGGLDGAMPRDAAGREYAFFENAGGSFPARAVTDRLHRFYQTRKVQPYAPYPASEAGGAEMDEARARLAALMNMPTGELSFGPSTSANTYVLANAVRIWLRGQNAAIVVTNQDHEANSGAWRRLADEGIAVREWRIDPQTGALNIEDLRALLADGAVKLVAFPHCSNVVAQINDVPEICALARAHGARTVVDGVSYAPHGLPDFPATGADVYLFSSYKTYGPHQGIMLVRESFANQLPAQGHWFNAGTLYKRLTPAGPDHAQIAACAGMADYIDALHDHHFGPNPDAAARGRATHTLMRAAEVATIAPLLEYLAGRNDLRLLGPRVADARAPTLAVALDRAAEPVATALAAHGIAASGGDFYAVRPIEAMGINREMGVLRLSAVHYTSPDDVARAILALDQVLARG